MDDLGTDQARAFMQELDQDFAAVRSGIAPDPASVTEGYANSLENLQIALERMATALGKLNTR